MFCPGCGTNNEDHVRFCYRCGRQLNDGSATTSQAGPAWGDFVEPVAEPEPAPPPPPEPTPPPPPPPQVVIGKPKRELPIAMLAGVVLAIGALVGAGYGVYYATQNLDKDSLPLLGDSNEATPATTTTATANQPAILVSLTSSCKDTNNQACNLVWDLTNVKAEPAGLRIDYEVRATGQTGCSIAIQADQGLTSFFESAGRPGPFVEGARGRYYPLRTSEGMTSAGGNLSCGETKKGAWVFGAITGETFVKLRYPGLPPARIEFSPLSVRTLPTDDPFSVIPAQQTGCQTTQNQACNGVWEIGPYGLAADGAPIVFFAVRFDGPAGCQVAWQDDVAASSALIAGGNRGIGLELADKAGFLLLSAGGGLSSQNGPQKCGTVFTGFWRFARGNVSANVNLIYPDIPVVQIPLKP